MGSTRNFKKTVGGRGSGTAALTGTLACGCDIDGREPELGKPVPKWWCCGAFQKRKTATPTPTAGLNAVHTGTYKAGE